MDVLAVTLWLPEMKPALSTPVTASQLVHIQYTTAALCKDKELELQAPLQLLKSLIPKQDMGRAFIEMQVREKLHVSGEKKRELSPFH